ncbi:hypothetical protein OZX62_00755 [Bifidobacterium sp. ESL0690]|uniref:hypothetical protein n=1 Tax=Bifidobacterium sp. ESL0690 TaxID=2983214 RepID=UPI0023F7A0D4|nr:hypothetical protein [Bifidobacterium sp. ESL0690]WEV46864.1 hypothetical protein OZX62_00755 [Bifidobacterium sp. ESL0690]
MEKSQLRQKTGLRTATALLLAALTMFFVTACGSAPTANTQQTNKPEQPKTEKIVFDKTYVVNFFYDSSDEKHPVRTPQAVAKDLMDSNGTKYFTKVYAAKNGDVVALVTEQQRQNGIRRNNNWIKQGEKNFQKGGPDYHYEVNQDGTAMTVWADKHLTPDPSFGIFTLAPINYGYNYYLERHTGPWDMTITVRNCHTNQQVGQFNASQGFTLNPATFGD